MQERALYYDLESTFTSCSSHRHKFTGRLVLFSEYEIKGCVCIDEYDDERVWMPAFSCKSIESLDSWLQDSREEWEKKSLVPKILAQGEGRSPGVDDVLIIGCTDDTVDVVIVMTGEEEGDAINRIQEELQQNISVNWLNRMKREEEVRLLMASEKVKLHVNAIGRERAMLALMEYHGMKEEEREVAGVGKWIKRRGNSLGSLAKALFAFPRDNYRSIDGSETSENDSCHDDNDGPYVCLEEGGQRKAFAEASFAFHQAYH